jgi:hypothetical protein
MPIEVCARTLLPTTSHPRDDFSRYSVFLFFLLCEKLRKEHGFFNSRFLGYSEEFIINCTSTTQRRSTVLSRDIFGYFFLHRPRSRSSSSLFRDAGKLKKKEKREKRQKEKKR